MSVNQYTLPEDPHLDWRGCETRGYLPTPRQAALLKVYAEARNAGLHYTSQILPVAAKQLGLTAEELARNHSGVEHGDFGYDLYMARSCYEARLKHDAASHVQSLLGDLPCGTSLGTLVFNDFKRTTGVVVHESTGPNTKVLRGKRGRYQVEFKAELMQIKSAIERAASQGHRKDSFEEFCGSLTMLQPTRPVSLA